MYFIILYYLFYIMYLLMILFLVLSSYKRYIIFRSYIKKILYITYKNQFQIKFKIKLDKGLK